MKLSKVLKDWPKKWKPIKTLSNGDPRCEGFNQALASCDREIDMEALAEIIEDSDMVKSKIELVDLIISTMPTWLKPTERK